MKNLTEAQNKSANEILKAKEVINEITKQLETETENETEISYLNNMTKVEFEAFEALTNEKKIEYVYSNFTDENLINETIADIEADIEAEALTSTSDVQSKAFLNGSDSLALPIYLNSLQGKFTSALQLRKLSLELKDSVGKLAPMQWASFNRTMNTSNKKLILNKAHNLKRKPNEKRERETIEYFDSANQTILGFKGKTSNTPRFNEFFKEFIVTEEMVKAKDSKFKNSDIGKVKQTIKVIVISPEYKSNNLFNSGHCNKFLVKPESLPLFKAWLLLKGAKEEDLTIAENEL